MGCIQHGRMEDAQPEHRTCEFRPEYGQYLLRSTAVGSFECLLKTLKTHILAGENFNYTRLPHVSHGIFTAAPIQGTYALPQDPSDEVIDHLRNLALAQSRLHGMAPSAVAFAPPPPARGRSRGRSESVRRAVSTPPAQSSELTRVPSGLGVFLSEFLCWGAKGGGPLNFSVRTFHQPRWSGRCCLPGRTTPCAYRS